MEQATRRMHLSLLHLNEWVVEDWNRLNVVPVCQFYAGHITIQHGGRMCVEQLYELLMPPRRNDLPSQMDPRWIWPLITEYMAQQAQ